MRASTSRNRLLAVARKLRSIRREQFYFGNWASPEWQGKPDLSCGTTACGLGWATTIPSLRKAGLRIVRRAGGHIPVLGDHVPHYGTDAAAELFGITFYEAAFLFLPEIYNDEGEKSPARDCTPKQLARHIERFCRRRFPARSR